MPFTKFGLHPTLLAGVRDMGYDQPTPIQLDAIPPAMAGRDLLACAMTGSGKTAAFVLPTLHRLLGKSRGVTRVLVLTPTRELAAQIEENTRALGAHTNLKSAAVFGGVAMGPQERAFRTGVDVLIATPGRLLDHFQYPYAKLPGIEILILDEADRMLDMGFLPDIRRVLKHLPTTPRQTLFFSATMPQPIVVLSRELLSSPAMVNVERKAAPAEGVTQTLFPVRDDLKSALLLEMLQRDEIKSALVFTRTKHRANRLADYLNRHGVPCERIHGNRSQAQRTLALSRFKEGKDRVLVATDIAARGIDVELLSHVINLDVPNIPEDYIHRVGRTARAGAVGEAFTFVGDNEGAELAAIERAIGKKLPRKKLEGFDYERKVNEKLEIPIAERIAKIRSQRSEERARAKEKAVRKATGVPAARQPGQSAGGNVAPTGGRGPSGPRPGEARRPQGGRPGQGQAPRGASPGRAPRNYSTATAPAGRSAQSPGRSPERGALGSPTTPWHLRGASLDAPRRSEPSQAARTSEPGRPRDRRR
ncbi:MAG TPA: DEAD/DEAH box helicase [Thermoanaerobaculia bacterium]|nr:DEAD/DEAH box helicase [Thermoanaerobaculia bacterium]